MERCNQLHVKDSKDGGLSGALSAQGDAGLPHEHDEVAGSARTIPAIYPTGELYDQLPAAQAGKDRMILVREDIKILKKAMG